MRILCSKPAPPTLAETGVTPPPRVLLVIPGQWPRALLRAELRERGCDALGARDLGEAMIHPAIAPARGPVRLVVIDQDALAGAGEASVTRVLQRHAGSVAMLLARGGTMPPAGPWQRVIHRPVTIAAIADAVLELVPIPAQHRHPVD